MVSRARRAGSPRPRSWVITGVIASTLVAVADGIRNDHILLTGVIAGPMLAAIGATSLGVVVVSVYALALAVWLGEVDHIFGSSDHGVLLAVVGAGCVAAIISAALRQRRDNELAVTRPQALHGQRLRLALDASRMGTWRWDLRNGHVEWDIQLEALYGLDPGTFKGTMHAYESLVHPDDRARVRAAVDEGMANNRQWRFDHRVVWPDGSVHWLEGRGEPDWDESGAIIGASGVSVNIDQRHALLEAETRARESAERSSALVQRLADISSALAGATTVDEVAHVIVDRAVAALHARSGYFATVDESTHELVMRAQSGYPQWIVRKYRRIAMTALLPGPEAIRTGRSIFLGSNDERRSLYPHFPDDPTHAAIVVVPLPPIDGARAVVVFGFAEPRVFAYDDRRYIGAVVEACAQALQRANAFEAEQAARRRLRTLLDGSEQLGMLDDPRQVVAAIATIAATRIGMWATVSAIAPDGKLQQTVVAHRDPEKSATVRDVMTRLSDGGDAIRRVLDSGRPMVLRGLTETASRLISDDPDVYAKLMEIGYEACMLVPITIAGRRLAVLTIGDDRPGHLQPGDVELAVDLGRRGATALERAQLWQTNQQRFEAEHRTVELLQRTIVPDRLPDLKGVELAAAYRPAEVDVDVGGDWYDAFVAPDDSIVIVVGDVAGHGIQAASLMGRARNALRAYAVEDSDPASILFRLHTLLRSQDSGEMVTAFVARYVPGSNLMSWSRAGHPPPLLVEPGARPRFLSDVNGAPLGTMARAYEAAQVALPVGSLLVGYTDGLIERRDRILDDGLAWLADRVHDYAGDELEALCDKLVDDPFVPHPSPDDVCVLALRTL